MADNLPDNELNHDIDSNESQIINNEESLNQTSDIPAVDTGNDSEEIKIAAENETAIDSDLPILAETEEVEKAPDDKVEVKEETTEPVEEPTTEPVEEPTPEPVEEPNPEPVEEPNPEPVEEPTPEPVEEPNPEPVPAPAPEPVEMSVESSIAEFPADDAGENVRSVAEPDVTAAETVSTHAAEASSKAKEREIQNSKFDAIFVELQAVKEVDGIIDVKVIERIRGGLRVTYKDMPLFLPASHFGLKRNPSEQSMKDTIGKIIPVQIHELQEDETKRKTVIVSRKNILEDKFWKSLAAGDIIEGPITSIASFGIFIDVYGVEGLVHVTRLSNTRIDDLNATFKKGQLVKAVIVEVNKDRKRIGLSTKELEESPWKGISAEVQPGTIVKGIVRRITEFGAYIEIKPGIDGLVRTSELSWTTRIKHPNEVFTLNEEVELYVISLNEEKQSMALSLKRKIENPWKELTEKYPAQTKTTGVIKYLVPQGAVINVNNEVDGFMPRSKMRFLPKGTANPGDTVDLIVDGIDLEKESIIVIPIIEEKPQFKPKEREKPRGDSQHRSKPSHESQTQANNESADFTLQDLISEAMKKDLLKG